MISTSTKSVTTFCFFTTAISISSGVSAPKTHRDTEDDLRVAKFSVKTPYKVQNVVSWVTSCFRFQISEAGIEKLVSYFWR